MEIQFAFGMDRYLRDFEIESIGMKKTPQRCSGVKCRSRLKDTVLDWDVTIL